MNRYQFFTKIFPYLLLTLFLLTLPILSTCILTSTPAPTTISLALPTSSPTPPDHLSSAVEPTPTQPPVPSATLTPPVKVKPLELLGHLEGAGAYTEGDFDLAGDYVCLIANETDSAPPAPPFRI